MRYIPPDKRDTRYPLWCIVYECKVPWNEMRSIQDIEMFGNPHTGDPDLDRETATELRNVRIPVERMAELYSEGARILLKDPHIHAKTIYADIMSHLRAWARTNEFSFNSPSIPSEDLLMFDALAEALWPMTQATMPIDYSNGEFATIVRKLGMSDRRRDMAELFPEKAIEDKNAQHNQQRTRMSDFFTQ